MPGLGGGRAGHSSHAAACHDKLGPPRKFVKVKATSMSIDFERVSEIEKKAGAGRRSRQEAAGGGGGGDTRQLPPEAAARGETMPKECEERREGYGGVSEGGEGRAGMWHALKLIQKTF